jgi:hypothetical protein
MMGPPGAVGLTKGIQMPQACDNAARTLLAASSCPLALIAEISYGIAP